MAAEKKAFEPHAHVNEVYVALDDGREVRLKGGETYETSNEEEIRALESAAHVKAAEKKGGK